jgi:hypothetical protein
MVMKLIPAPVIGNAQAVDVRSGKTFSSQAGGIGKTGGLVTQVGGQTITPGTANQALAAGIYDSANTVKGDPNLVPGNIANGVSIFGVAGTSAQASGSAIPADVLTGYTFSSSGGTGQSGTMPNNGAVAITPSASSQAIPAGYHNGSGAVSAVPHATGTATTDSAGNITVSGLTFQPRAIMTTSNNTDLVNNGAAMYSADVSTTSQTMYSSGQSWITLATYSGYVNSTGFKLKTSIASGTVYWKAYM